MENRSEKEMLEMMKPEQQEEYLKSQELKKRLEAQLSQPAVRTYVPPDKEAYLTKYFQYHAPKGDQGERYKRINDALMQAASVIFDCAPSSPERTLALRCLEDARMRANQAIAVNEG